MGGVPEILVKFMFIKNSYRRETCVVLFHLQVRFWEKERNVGDREQCLMTIIPAIWEVEGGGLWFKAILGRELSRPHPN
jgi:hypothetical protein